MQVGGAAAALVVAAVAVAVGLAVAGGARSAMRRRSGHREGRVAGWGEPALAARLVIVVSAVAAACLEPIIAPFALVLALNMSLGVAENVPFSTYPMFAAPSDRSYALRFEHQGEPFNIVQFGVLPPAVRQRFGKALIEERAAGAPDAEERAATRIVDLIEARRPMAGPLAEAQISVVLVDYEFDGTAIKSRRRVLAVMAPP